MKRRVLIVSLLVLTLVFSFLLCSCNDKEKEDTPVIDPNKITIFSDTHVVAAEQFGNTITPGLAGKLNANEKVFGLSEAILKTAIDDFIAGDSGILIITGDLTDDGAKVAHQSVARELKRAEAAGKRCYVVNGNHDINNGATSYIEQETQAIENVSPEEFAEIFNDFGFSEALAKDPHSLSYTANLNDKYRLIAWDIAKYDLDPGTERSVTNRHDPYVTQGKLDWLEEQLDACYADGKEPFIITHFPILSHIGPLVGSFSHVNMQEETLSLLYGGNASFNFCGHVHQQDIATYSFETRDYYEIETGSLSFTTLPIRHFVDDGNEVKITTSQQSYVKEEYIPSFYSAEEKARILADLPAYVWNYQNAAFANYAYGKLYYDDICGIFGITDQESFDLTEEVVKAFYNTPLYDKDANGGKSIEGICKSYGVTDFPILDDAKTVGELISSLVKYNFAGDEIMTPTSPVAIQFKYTVYAACHTFMESKLLSRLSLIEECDDDLAQSTVEAIFETGKAEVVESGVIGIISKIPALANFEILGSKPFVGTPQEIANKIQTLLNTIKKHSDLLPEEGTIHDLIESIYDEETGLGYLIDFSTVEETGKGYIDINAVYTVLVSSIGKGLLTDEGAPDNTFSFPSPSLNYSPETTD